jgi:EF hand domain-containing protein
MNMRWSFYLICALAGTSLVAACAQDRPRFERGGPRGAIGGMARGLFVSPAGEPFRRTESGGPPIRAWFAQADGDGDGAVGWAEFEADFEHYFAVLDADHDGEIAPAEVTRYETEILPEMSSRAFGAGGGQGRFMGAPGRGRRGGMGGGGGGGRGGFGRGESRGRSGAGARMAMMSGAARFGLLPISHPIMEADADFNRGVTLSEYGRAAARRFALLDRAHSGTLVLADLVQSMRSAGPRRGAANRPD